MKPKSRSMTDGRVLGIILVFTIAEGWEEKEISTKGVRDGRKEGEGRDGAMNNTRFSPFLAPSPTVNSDSNSNMAITVTDTFFDFAGFG